MPAVPKVQSAEPDSEASPVSASSVVPGEPVWTLESLLQAAAKVAGAKPASSKTPTINVLAIRQGGYGDEMDNTYALVDSGATHALRQAASTEEWSQASPVRVNLAGGETVDLRMNTAGTILVPRGSLTSAKATTPIVPLGALVSQLGYTMTWGNTKCRLEGRNGEVIQLKVREGCPEITEHEALKLIAQLEDSRLKDLRMNTAETRQRVRAAALAMEKHGSTT